jgi:Condensation domain
MLSLERNSEQGASARARQIDSPPTPLPAELSDLSVQDVFVPPLWYFDHPSWVQNPAQPGNIAHNYALPLRIRGKLDRQALRQSIEELLRRHSVLRSIFRIHDGELQQIVLAPSAVHLPVVDLGRLPEKERDAKATELAQEDATRPLDLSIGPMLRASLLELGPEDHILLLTTHHLVCDDWSTGILFRELGMLYAAFAAGEPSPLPELPCQYGDFVRWLDKRLQRRRDEGLAFWAQRLRGGATSQYVATDHARPSNRSYRGAHQRTKLPAELIEAVRYCSHQERASPFMVMFAAFQCLLYRYSGQEQVATGSCVANRPMVKSEGLIGPFGNVIVLRTDLSGSPTFREVLARTRDVALMSYSYQDVPFGSVVRHLQPTPDPSRTALCQVLFVMMDAPRQTAPPVAGLTMEPLPLDTGMSRYELNFWLKPGNGLEVDLQYNPELFDAITVKQILQDYQAVLQTTVRNPLIRVVDLDTRGPQGTGAL